MEKTLVLASLSFAAVACGDECPTEKADGSYAFEMVQLSGDCGAVGSSVVILKDGRSVGGDSADCTESSEWAGECSKTFDYTCNFGNGYSVRFSGYLDAENDFETMTGVVRTRGMIYGVQKCDSTYSVRYDRQ